MTPAYGGCRESASQVSGSHLLRLVSSSIGHLVAAALLLAPVSARATEEANAKLPPNPWGCQLCHASPEVTPDTVPGGATVPLTELGLSWASQSVEEADRLWSILASGNVDGDGCSTGFELGDPSGSYLPQDPPPADQSSNNPIENDCTLPLSEDSWSRLKALFDGS